jgi:SET domain-containing protein
MPIKLKNLIQDSYHINDACCIKPSSISGKGVIALKMIPKGQQGLAHLHSPSFDRYAHTDLGYYINHSETPNCVMISKNNKRFIESVQDIHPDDELTCNYWLNPADLEKPDTFDQIKRDDNGMRQMNNWNVKQITRLSEPYIKYVMIQK